MAEKSSAGATTGDKNVPFNWQDIDEDDELSFGSDYESDQDEDVVAAQSAAAKDDGNQDIMFVDTADHTDSPASPEQTTADDNNAHFAEVEPSTDAEKHGSGHPKLKDKVSSQQIHASAPSKPPQKAPREPVRWNPPPSTAGDGGERGRGALGGGLRGKPQGHRGLGVVQTTNLKHAFGAGNRMQLRMSGPRPPRGPGGLHGGVSGLRGRVSFPRAPVPVERGQFMSHRGPSMHTSRPPADGMGSAFDRLKTGAPVAAPKKSVAPMNPAAPPFQPRPPLPPRTPPQAHVATMPVATHFHRPIRPMAPVGVAMPAGFAVASTWVRGQSDPVDSKPARKPIQSSTWVNPNVVSAPSAPRPAAAITVPAAEEKPVQDAAALEAIRIKDAEIARLKAELEEKRLAQKRRLEKEQSPASSVRKAARNDRTGRTVLRSALGVEPRHGDEQQRPRGDIISRVQVATRDQDDVGRKAEDQLTGMRDSASPPTWHRSDDHGKDLRGRDEGHNAARRGSDRGDKRSRYGDDGRHKEEHRRAEKRGAEISEDQKRRLARFGAGRNAS